MEYIDGPTFNVVPFHGDYKPIEKVSLINGISAVDTPNGRGYIYKN